MGESSNGDNVESVGSVADSDDCGAIGPGKYHGRFLDNGPIENVFVAAHVAGFANNEGNHYVGSSLPTTTQLMPIPGGVVLAGLGMGFVGLVRRRIA